MRILLCLFFFYCLLAEKLSFDGHTVYRISFPPEKNEMVYDFAQYSRLDIWKRHWNEMDIRVPAEKKSDFLAFLKANDIKSTVYVENVQELIELSTPKNPNANFFDSYHSIAEINAWLNQTAEKYPTLATVFTLGHSYEKAPILGIKIQGKGTPAGSIFYNGGQHAREWISPATNTYLINQLLSLYGVNQTVTNLVDSLTWYIVPVVNVDGYAYTWTNDRMWRKTRSRHNPVCVGVDPNRNWDNHWCGVGTSTNPCSDEYCGPSPFSESEPKAVADFVSNKANKVIGYIDFHSYSQLWMTPWGWTNAKTADYTVQTNLAVSMVAAIKSVHGTVYTEGPIYTTVYPASSSSVDYTYGNASIVMSFAVELRDTGKYGFVLPPDQIIPQGEEVWAGVVVMGQYLSKKFQ